MFIKPAEGRISSGFRTSGRSGHNGVDIAKAGTVTVKAAAAGTVTQSYRSTTYGECVMIVHSIGGQTWETVYAHMRTGSRKVAVGQKVKQGQAIGLMGNTGRSSGQHLHFEVHKGRWNMQKSNAVDPLQFIGGNGVSGSSAVVENIQSTVKKRYGFKIKVDGIPGPETLKALVKAYQTELNKQFKRGLVVDGKWGPKTQAASVNIRSGAKGNLTWILQAMLEVKGYSPGKIDGVNGTKTQNALKAFQRANGLTADGVAGKQTWAKLFK